MKSVSRENFKKIMSVILLLLAAAAVVEFILIRTNLGEVRTAFYQDPESVLLLTQFFIFGLAGYYGLNPLGKRDMLILGAAPAILMVITLCTGEGRFVTFFNIAKTVLSVIYFLALILHFYYKASRKRRGRTV